MGEEKLILKVLSAPNVTKLLWKANDIGINKENFVSLNKSDGMYLLFYMG